MSGGRTLAVQIGMVLSVSLIVSCLTAVLLGNFYRGVYFRMLEAFCQELVENDPQMQQTVLSVLKTHSNTSDKLYRKSYFDDETDKTVSAKENLLLVYGYRQEDFGYIDENWARFAAVIGFGVGGGLYLGTLFLWHRKNRKCIYECAEYLEKVNAGTNGLLSSVGEGAFAKLQDALYKTVTMLYQTRENARTARNDFAENLSNIAHQMKTPITSISLSLQMIKEIPSAIKMQIPETMQIHIQIYLQKMEQQLFRLTYLEEALLLLARIDAGTLSLVRNTVDVFTLLVLAADNLQEIAEKAGVVIDIPELGEAVICVDLDWTMEAVINLMKNSIEHTPVGGGIFCSYQQNPLYTEICIWDTGNGFAKADIPHLFERFYRGKNAKEDGIGIGLALSKEIVEHQNGTLRAENRAEGGACFEIRFYHN